MQIVHKFKSKEDAAHKTHNFILSKTALILPEAIFSITGPHSLYHDSF
jgi:hypothetical protein